MDILEHLLTAPPEPVAMEGSEEGLKAWWHHHCEGLPFEQTVERAMAGGFAADRPAYAFASGYQETLRRLVDPPGPVLAAFCATEEGGAHPRAIQTTLVAGGDGAGEGAPLRLNGQKRFATLGPFAEELFVVARTGERDGRPVLNLARVDARRAGVTVEPLPPLPLIPEIPHAALRFDDVAVQPAEVLPGDGYLRYLKPMRTVEDIHVLAALLSWVLAVGRRSAWPAAILEDLLVPLAALRALAPLDPLAPPTHVALEGVLRQSEALLDEAEPEWERADPTTAERWQRDRPLLSIAATARARRAEAAWKRLMEE